MQIRQKYIIFDKPKNTPLPYIINFTRSDLLKIQVSGDGNCDIKIYGKINPIYNPPDCPIVGNSLDELYWFTPLFFIA